MYLKVIDKGYTVDKLILCLSPSCLFTKYDSSTTCVRFELCNNHFKYLVPMKYDGLILYLPRRHYLSYKACV